ncbi:MAG TPA: extracellular solute-binding protein [Phycisphaerae bacterium]|nr:extracellular solute-binding protein [Phycisphaerae bacterium]
MFGPARTAKRATLLVAAIAALTGAVARGADAPGGRTKITFWNLFTAGDSLRVVTDLVNRFNERQTAYFVEQVDIPYSHIHTKILPAVAGNVPPDVSIFDRFLVASFAGRGAFRPLDDLVGREGLRAEDFFKAPWEECFYGNRQFAVPYDTDVRVLYYNKKAFREAGLDPEKPPKTWSELRVCSQRLTKRRPDGRFDQVGYAPAWGNVGSLYLYGWQKGGRFLSEDGRTVMLNHPKNVEALQWIRDFTLQYDLEHLLSLQAGFGDWGSHPQNPFITGRVAMIVLDVGQLSTIQKYGAHLDWAAAPCPYADDGVPATWSGGFSLVIPKGSGCVEGAWAFCRHILTDESQRYMATSSNKLPALKGASDDPFFQSSAFWRLAIREMNHSLYRPITPVGQTIATEMQTAVDHVIHQKLTPQEALDVANAVCQETLDRFLEKTEAEPIDWRIWATAIAGAVGLLIAVRGWYSYRRIKAMQLGRRQAVAGYLFAAPAILGLAIFVIGPVIAALVYSFTRYEIITSASWVGLENYRELFTEDRYFLKALWNTFYFTGISVPVNITLSLTLALLLNREIGGRSFYRTAFYLPTVVPLVAGSLLWMWLFNGEFGLINIALSYLGLPDVPWLTSEYCSKPAIIVMGMWHVGGGMIIFLAALQGVPRSLYEAARIDGAGAWSSFRHITLPMISPAMFFMTVMGVIGAVQVFTQAYLMTNGGPVNSTLFYVLYLFRQAFQDLHMGYASAMAWVLFVFVLAVTGLQFLLAKRWVYYEGART